VIYHKQRRPKSIPLLVRKFKKLYGTDGFDPLPKKPSVTTRNPTVEGEDTLGIVKDAPVQLRLLQ